MLVTGRLGKEIGLLPNYFKSLGSKIEIRFLKEKLSLCKRGKTTKRGLEYDFLVVVTQKRNLF